MKLYIIGNGFDLNHGMKTAYWDYREFLAQNHSTIKREYENSPYLKAYNCDSDSRWSDLESSLRIEFEECMSDLSGNYYPDMNSERTPGWDDIAIEVDNNFSFMELFTREYFYEWIYDVQVPNGLFKREDIDKTASFVTFNYTKTLEDTYCIPSDNILHIHGSVDDLSTIQFGTPENHPDSIYSSLENQYSDDDFYNVTYAPAIGKISAYANSAYKNLQDNFSILRNFVLGYSKIDEVIIMGHSYLGIDEPYYANVFVPLLQDLRWYIYVYNKSDIDMAQSFITKYGLSSAQMIKW